MGIIPKILFLQKRMSGTKAHKHWLLAFLMLCTIMLQAQVKSTNIQTFEGKKFYIHKIEKSQSLYAISKAYNVAMDELYKYNPELKAGAKANQEIKIPYTASAAPAPTPTVASSATVVSIDTNRFITHRIIKGETMYSLGRKYNLSEKELTTFNPTITQGLREGQLIAVGEKNRKRVIVKPAVESKSLAPPSKEKPINAHVDSSALKMASKPKKSNYRIALMLPFSLQQTLQIDNAELARTNSNFPELPSLAVDFYLGFKKAVDSLNVPGFELQLDLYDVDEKDSAKAVAICAQPEFKQTDMIFGPLYAQTFKTVSKKAKEASIPTISPFTWQNKILYNNNYISKTNPSQFTLMECLQDYIVDSLAKPSGNIILMILNEKDRKEMAFVTAFKKYYNERQKSTNKNLRDTLAIARGMAGVKLNYKKGANNIIVCLSTNQVYFTDFATHLALFNDNKDITLCGWQSFTEIDNLDQAYLEQLHYTFPHQFNYIHLDPYKGLIHEYNRIQESYPSENYFIGFDIAYFYLKNLQEKGPDFVQNLDQCTQETNYMRFHFARPDKTTGFDNRGVYIFKYKDFQISGTGWK